MPELTLTSFLALLTGAVTWIFGTATALLKSSYDASHKWFAIGVVAFVALVWLGYAHLPTLPSKDAALAKSVADLSLKLDALNASVDALKAPPPATVKPQATKKK